MAEAGEWNVIGGELEPVGRSYIKKPAATCDGLGTIHVGHGLPLGMGKRNKRVEKRVSSDNEAVSVACNTHGAVARRVPRR